MKELLFSKRFIFSVVIIAVLYYTSIAYVMNNSLINNTVIGNYPIKYKFDLLSALFLGVRNNMTTIGFSLLVLNALLTGLVITLMIDRVILLKHIGTTNFFAGGASFLGLAGSGCAACGLPILSLIGIPGSLLGHLPYQGLEISFLASGLLILSLYILLRNRGKVVACKVKQS